MMRRACHAVLRFGWPTIPRTRYAPEGRVPWCWFLVLLTPWVGVIVGTPVALLSLLVFDSATVMRAWEWLFGTAALWLLGGAAVLDVVMFVLMLACAWVVRDDPKRGC